MRILVVEDEVIIAEDILEVLREFDYKVLAVHNYEDAIKATYEFLPDLAICDIDLAQGKLKTGIDFVNFIKKDFPTMVVVYISAIVNEFVLENAQTTKPFTYLVKPFVEKQLITTVKLVHNFIQSFKQSQQNRLHLLTPTEMKILLYIAKGFTSKKIANELYVSEKTIKNHRYNILKKLDLPEENNSLTKWALANLNVSF